MRPRPTRRPKKGPITGWEPGRKMLTLVALRSGNRPGQHLPPGETVTLDRFCRVQDGLEIWEVWANGVQLWAAHHQQIIEKV